MIKLPGEGAWSGTPLEPGVLNIGQPDIGDQTFRALQLKGPIPNELERQIGLSIQVLDFQDPEYRYLKRESLAWGGGPLAAGGAGNFGFGSLRGVDGKILVVEQIWLANATAAVLEYRVGTQAQFPAGVGATPGIPRDTRMGVNATQGGAVRLGVDPAPTLPPLPFSVLVPIGNTVVLQPNVILNSATSFLSCIANTANVRVDVAFLWRERAMLTSEQ